MKMLIIAVYLIGAVAVFLFLSNTQISMNPFSIKVNDWMLGLAWVFMILSISLFKESSRMSGLKEGYEKGLNQGCEISREAAREVIKERIQELKDSLENVKRSTPRINPINKTPGEDNIII